MKIKLSLLELTALKLASNSTSYSSLNHVFVLDNQIQSTNGQVAVLIERVVD